MPYYYGYAGGFGFWTVLWHILIAIIFIWIVILVVRALCGGPRRWRRGFGGPRMTWSAHSALELLNERYARGEIDKAEYEERKKTLLGN